jgi:hypothetical protein
VNDVNNRTADTKPPALPWVPLADSSRGYLSVYYSDPLARYPVRDITRPADNKSDPNIETLTYGLFSTCEPQMRNRIVQDHAATLFFVTSLGARSRAITGYYVIGWHTLGTRGAQNRDYALAARKARFIDPIPLADLKGELATACCGPYRTCKRVSPGTSAELRQLVDSRPDRLQDYLGELHRLERFARSRTGYAYPSWGREEGFSWQDAPAYYYDGTSQDTAAAPNSSRSGKWRCTACQRVITNAALLKRCPVCSVDSTLVPELREAAK